MQKTEREPLCLRGVLSGKKLDGDDVNVFSIETIFSSNGDLPVLEGVRYRTMVMQILH